MRGSQRVVPASAILAFAFAMACSSPSEVCDAGLVTGRWSYQATQEVPVRATISGSMAVSSGNCVDFQGVLDVVEVLATGETRRVAGLVSGTIVTESMLRFEVVFGDGTREHLARLASDSLVGDWVQSAGTISGNGHFGARRTGGL